MALALRGVAEGLANTGATVTVTHPGGIAENDVVFIGYTIGNSTVDRDMAMTTASYTELADLYANDSTDTNFGVFRKVMGATPDSTAVCTGVDSSTIMAAVESVWTGVDTTTP